MENKREEKAVFVGIIRQNDDERKIYEYLDELQFLAETAGATGDKKFVQRVDRPDKATYIRTGKLKEIADYCEENHIDYVIFDDELTGMQQRNIEKVIKTHSAPRRPTPRRRSNWPATITCSPASPVCGRTSSASAAVWVRAAAWARPRSRWTAASCANASPN